jgi:regulatory protein
MKITDIKQQVKRPDRYSVYVDGRYAFSLADIEASNSGLRIGLELSANKLAELQHEAKISKAYNQVLGLIARRLRSQWEIESYLLRKGYDLDLSSHIIDKLQRLGYADDRVFAEAWLRDRRLFKSVSKRRLSQELRVKRVADEIIKEVLAEDQVGDSDTLTELIAKKRRQSRYQDNTKLMQYLARQGFSYDDIKRAMDG